MREKGTAISGNIIGVAGASVDDGDLPRRPCAYPGCRAYLSQYNRGSTCYHHPKEEKAERRFPHPINSYRVPSPLPRQPERIIRTLIAIVSEAYGISSRKLLDKHNRPGNGVHHPRQLAIFLARRRFPRLRLTDFEPIFRRDTSNIANACRHVQEALDVDDTLKKWVNQVLVAFGGTPVE